MCKENEQTLHLDTLHSERSEAVAKYTYKAKKGVDEISEGVMEGQSQGDVLNRLVEQGLFPISIELQSIPAKEEVLKQKFTLDINIIAKKRITSKDLLVFTQKLSTLIRAKVELLSALKILYEQTEHPRLKEIILALYGSTKEGNTFSESLAKFPEVFSSLFVNIIKAGEASGRLDYALNQISEFSYRKEVLRNKVVSALVYPILLLLVGLMSIFVLINFVIPKLAVMFESLRKELPFITRIILKISKFSQETSLWVFLIIILGVLILLWRKGSSFFSLVARKLKMKLPVVRRLVKNQEFAHFSRALSLLLRSGVQVLNSLKIAMPSIEDTKMREELSKVYDRVAAGETLYKALETETSLPKFFIKMVAVGEESGRLDEVLEEISHSYTQQVEADIAVISSLLEPLLILLLGIILGSIVLSVLLPIFQITQAVR